MMKYLVAFSVLLASGLMAHASSEDNVIELMNQADMDGNTVELLVTGSNNGLHINQTLASGAVDGNIMNISINGDFNGGPLGARFSGALAASGLEPGHLTQIGFNNRMDIDVDGSNNLFSFLQNGSGNSIDASIQGTGNQAAIQQYGQNNHVSMSQVGSGNMIAISQRSF
ncbi:Curlin associated repeat-containing protein [Cohaesibacter sp. ES.047]|uniref:hypothetical protein n=1 Tax=Cohaesibacter sp. ES.047 TaxID=1798205 RepID=UPI000BBF76D2|nr:hypothetical protein [Cohaesibacter sp. ES.047]SNY94137.1 Curlin associated repeat-containing protein [Cohaesibacter sp. ES.047]